VRASGRQARRSAREGNSAACGRLTRGAACEPQGDCSGDVLLRGSGASGGVADVGDPYAEGEQAPRGSARRRDALERVGATRHDVDDFPFRLHVFDQP
jgi:hypothetical protein